MKNKNVIENDVDKDRIEVLNMVNKLLESYEENIPSLPASMQIFKQTAKYINIMQEIESAEKEVLIKLRDTIKIMG